MISFFFFQAEDGIRDGRVTGVQTCALPISGPLLHRTIVLTAQSYAPGALPSPATVGAVPAMICRLSGLRATPECPGMVEWFVPGTEPARTCDWHRGASVHLPPEYADRK